MNITQTTLTQVDDKVLIQCANPNVNVTDLRDSLLEKDDVNEVEVVLVSSL